MNAHAAWFLARGSGVVAYVLLSASTVWGLLLSTRLLGGGRRTRRLMLAHESLSLGAILATLVHMAALVGDTWVDFGWSETLVIGASPWRPLAVAWGVAAFYGMVVVTGSFYVRARIGQRAWRWLHFASFGLYLSATLHGIQAGADSGTLAMQMLYLDSVVLVGVLTVLRAMAGRTAGGRALRPGRTEPRTPAHQVVRSTSPGP